MKIVFIFTYSQYCYCLFVLIWDLNQHRTLLMYGSELKFCSFLLHFILCSSCFSLECSKNSGEGVKAAFPKYFTAWWQSQEHGQQSAQQMAPQLCWWPPAWVPAAPAQSCQRKNSHIKETRRCQTLNSEGGIPLLPLKTLPSDMWFLDSKSNF